MKMAFRLLDIDQPKRQQLEAVQFFVKEKNDVFVQLPTGFGKSACFQVLPLLFDIIHARSLYHMVLVICPLISIIENQVDFLTNHVVGAVDLTKVAVERWHQATQNVQVLFSTPEQLLTPTGLKPEAKELLRSLQPRCVGLILDEVHTVVKWGDDFRPEYGLLARIHDLLSCQVMSLTATATGPIVKEIRKRFSGPSSPFHHIREDPSRPNITLTIRPWNRVRGEVVSLFREFIEKGQGLPRTVLFFNNFRLMGEALLLLQTVFKQFPQLEEHFALYHALRDRDRLKVLLQGMTADDGVGGVRLLFASSAFGMGVDVPGITRVWHVEAPHELDDYVQQIGRAARRPGTTAEAVLFSRTTADLEASMKGYVKNASQCRHQIIKTYFEFPGEPTAISGPCCDVCQTIEN